MVKDNTDSTNMLSINPVNSWEWNRYIFVGIPN